MNLKKDIKNYTLDELKDLYKIPKTKIQKMLEEQGLKIKYIGRTPYTKQLIPIEDTIIKKYQIKKTREKTNSTMLQDMEERNWPQCEIESRQKDLDNMDFKIGQLCYSLSETQKELNNIFRSKVNQQFMINMAKKVLETNDWCGFIEEERWGKRPDINKLDVSMLTDQMVLGYLTQKLNPVLLTEIAKALEE